MDSLGYHGRGLRRWYTVYDKPYNWISLDLYQIHNSNKDAYVEISLMAKQLINRRLRDHFLMTTNKAVFGRLRRYSMMTWRRKVSPGADVESDLRLRMLLIESEKGISFANKGVTNG